jgi:hypothetical protein
MNNRPIHQYWPLFVALPLFFGFSMFNLYYGFVHGEIIGSRVGTGWVSFATRPYWFSFAIILYAVMAVIFGGGIFKFALFLYLRARSWTDQ